MSQEITSNSEENSKSNPTDESSAGQIFADDAGRGVFDAFEKLGSELNCLTENLECQFEDAGEGEDFLGGFDFKGIFSASIFGGDGKAQNSRKEESEQERSVQEPIVDDLIAMLNQDRASVEAEEQQESSSKGHVKRDSMDADSIASGGSHGAKKISALINQMRIRSLSVDESSVGGGNSVYTGVNAGDEWDNDDDCGYTIITLTEEEFFDYEEETSAKILAERREQAAQNAKPPVVQQPDSPPQQQQKPKPVEQHAAQAQPQAAEPNLAKTKLSYAAVASTNADVVSPTDDTEGGDPAQESELAEAGEENHPVNTDSEVGELGAEKSVYEPYDIDDSEEIVVDLTTPSKPPLDTLGESIGSKTADYYSPKSREDGEQGFPDSPARDLSQTKEKEPPVVTSTGERSADHTPKEKITCSSPTAAVGAGAAGMEQLAAMLAQGAFGSPDFPPLPTPSNSDNYPVPPVAPAAGVTGRSKAPAESRRQSVGEKRRSEIMGQRKFMGVDGMHCYFNLKVIFEPYKTGFEESKDLQHDKGTIIAGRYEVHDVLGQAAFSTALQCIDLAAEEDEAQWVCLKVIKNNKDFFDQSLDEIKLLQYINSCGEPDDHNVLRLIDFFYYKEHLFIVSELLKENLYEFGRFIRDSDNEPYYTIPRLKRITKQVLEALVFIHSLKLIHCDIKPENIVIKSFSRCEVKLIDFGSSCFTTDHLTTYIQSRSYRAPEVIIGHPYDTRIDIWSVGAVLAELHTGYVLFQNDSVPTMLSRITGILGQFPPHVLQRGKDTGKYFSLSNIVYERDEEGSFQLIFPKRTDLAARLHLPVDGPNGTLSHDDELFIDFVRQMLHLDPTQRMTAEEALAHPWLADADTVHIGEYIINQAVQPPMPAEYGDEFSGSREEEEYDYEDDDLNEAEAEEAALQYLINSHGGTAAAMQAYLAQMEYEQQQEDDGEEDDEQGEGSDGDEEDEQY